jgi:glycine/D-amino acid oxidase-like deaminating enzyme/nitrite reductase/ring-hydroxylating ferredoxin subunit
METLSVWRGTAAGSGYAMLQGDVQCDVLVIGGGITGVTLALLLAQQGRRTVLLEAGEIGGGSTGNSTGNLYQTVSQGLSSIASPWGDDVARQVTAERGQAVAFIEQMAQRVGGAGFRRCPLVRYAMSADAQQEIDQEAEALAKAGLRVERRRDTPPGLPAAAGEVLVLHDQAQFQPQAYVLGIAQLAAQAGAQLHEHSRVIEIDTKARRAVTATGSVQAAELVMATHTPKGIRLAHAQMPVHREYGLAYPLTGLADPGPGIFWISGDESLSVRTVDTDQGRFLVCVGEEFEVGHHNARAALIELENLAGKHLGAVEPTYRWSAQNYRAADGLPYIGRDASGCFIATGFATDGLTWGTLAAQLIAQQVAGQSPAFADLCKPTRLSPIKGGKTILQENALVVKHLVQDWLTHRQEEKLASLAPGDSAIVESEGESFAAWRSPDGELFAVSPVCTHMGCKVHWNSAETSWDCPCHGSRFRPDGTVIEGPALIPLKRKQLRGLEGEPAQP